MHVAVAVIGRGMIGSAAARHLAERGVSTALIGPLEAEDRQASQGPFSSHPDEGRITRIFGRTPIWTALAAHSIARYADIAERSGIDFYTPSGCVALYPHAQEWIDNAEGYGADAEMMTPEWLFDTFGVAAPDGVAVAYERSPAGHINPRRLVAAQARLAGMAGAELVEEAATAMRRESGSFAIRTSGGAEVTADRVLVATGAFGAELLDVELDVERRARTVLMAEMGPLDGLPCVIGDAPDARLNEFYWVPPVPYPFGKTCLKIGGDLADTRVLEPGELVEWFHGDGAADEIDALETSLRALLPGAPIASITTSPCVITGSPTGHPYIGWVDDGVAVAIAGNGSSAKSSDEIGRLGSTLFDDDGWTDVLDAAEFTPRVSS